MVLGNAPQTRGMNGCAWRRGEFTPQRTIQEPSKVGSQGWEINWHWPKSIRLLGRLKGRYASSSQPERASHSLNPRPLINGLMPAPPDKSACSQLLPRHISVSFARPLPVLYRSFVPLCFNHSHDLNPPGYAMHRLRRTTKHSALW